MNEGLTPCPEIVRLNKQQDKTNFSLGAGENVENFNINCCCPRANKTYNDFCGAFVCCYSELTLDHLDSPVVNPKKFFKSCHSPSAKLFRCPDYSTLNLTHAPAAYVSFLDLCWLTCLNHNCICFGDFHTIHPWQHKVLHLTTPSTAHCSERSGNQPSRRCAAGCYTIWERKDSFMAQD